VCVYIYLLVVINIMPQMLTIEYNLYGPWKINFAVVCNPGLFVVLAHVVEAFQVIELMTGCPTFANH